MRTTVNLEDDVAAAVERLRKERDLGLSEAVNELIRRGLARRPERKRFVQKGYPMGERIDVTNIGKVLEYLDAPE